MSSKKEFEHVSIQDQKAIVKYLNALSEGIEKGRLIMGSGDKQFSLEPGKIIKLDIRGKRKKDESKLVLKLSWKSQESKMDFIEDPLIIISKEARV